MLLLLLFVVAHRFDASVFILADYRFCHCHLDLWINTSVIAASFFSRFADEISARRGRNIFLCVCVLRPNKIVKRSLSLILDQNWRAYFSYANSVRHTEWKQCEWNWFLAAHVWFDLIWFNHQFVFFHHLTILQMNDEPRWRIFWFAVRPFTHFVATVCSID